MRRLKYIEFQIVVSQSFQKMESIELLKDQDIAVIQIIKTYGKYHLSRGKLLNTIIQSANIISCAIDPYDRLWLAFEFQYCLSVFNLEGLLLFQFRYPLPMQLKSIKIIDDKLFLIDVSDFRILFMTIPNECTKMTKPMNCFDSRVSNGIVDSLSIKISICNYMYTFLKKKSRILLCHESGSPRPLSLAMLKKTGEIFVSYDTTLNIHVFNNRGLFLREFSSNTGREHVGSVCNEQIACDDFEQLWILDPHAVIFYLLLLYISMCSVSNKSISHKWKPTALYHVRLDDMSKIYCDIIDG